MVAVVAVGLMIVAGGCHTVALGTRPCVVSSASGAEFELRGRGAAVEVSHRTSEGVSSLASLGATTAAQGALVVSSGDAGGSGATIVVLGPPAMARASVPGQPDVAATVCNQAAISTAAIPVEIGSSVTVVGYDDDGTQLFERYTEVTESGGVVAPIGSPPAT